MCYSPWGRKESDMTRQLNSYTGHESVNCSWMEENQEGKISMGMKKVNISPSSPTLFIEGTSPGHSPKVPPLV